LNIEYPMSKSGTSRFCSSVFGNLRFSGKNARGAEPEYQSVASSDEWALDRPALSHKCPCGNQPRVLALLHIVGESTAPQWGKGVTL